MKIVRYHDGSEGYRYEVGDRVIVKNTIQGGWFDYGPTHSDHCTIRRIDPRSPRAIAHLEVHYSDDWGLANCAPWQVEPHPETLDFATIITPEEDA